MWARLFDLLVLGRGKCHYGFAWSEQKYWASQIDVHVVYEGLCDLTLIPDVLISANIETGDLI